MTDKQALREVTEKAGKDKWQARKINGDFFVIRHGSYEKQSGITPYQPVKALTNMVPLNEPPSVITDIKSALVELQERHGGTVNLSVPLWMSVVPGLLSGYAAYRKGQNFLSHRSRNPLCRMKSTESSGDFSISATISVTGATQMNTHAGPTVVT
ncbi:TPA: hypothetical protein ACJGSF_004983 [Salmonella enterica subsp. enterica serovar Muenchen]